MQHLIYDLSRMLEAHDLAAAARLEGILETPTTPPRTLLRAFYQLYVEGWIDRTMLTRLIARFARTGMINNDALDSMIMEEEEDVARDNAHAKRHIKLPLGLGFFAWVPPGEVLSN